MSAARPGSGPSRPAVHACRILVMRHGPAEADSPSGRDFDRALSATGHGTTEAMARALVARGEGVGHIATSPLLRTRQTAEIVAGAFPTAPPLTVHDGLAPGENLHGVVQEMRGRGVTRLLVVAHAPDVSLLASALLERHVGSFEPAMILGLSLDAATSRELFVLRPSELAP